MKRLYTVGHSNRSMLDFIDILKIHNISAIADVRSTPFSRANKEFNQEILKEALKRNNIAYVFLGRELGGRPSSPLMYTDGVVQYRSIAKSNLFQEGLNRLIFGIEHFQIALMCSEKDPTRCHRFLLVTHELREKENLSIQHIIDKNKIEINSETEKRLLGEIISKQGSLFNEIKNIEDAYYNQNQVAAFKKETREVIRQ